MQESFVTAILGKPGLALLVKYLRWTLLRPHTKELNQSVLLGISQPRAILRIWDAFQCLTAVRTLDLAWLSRDHGDPLAVSHLSHPIIPPFLSSGSLRPFPRLEIFLLTPSHSKREMLMTEMFRMGTPTVCFLRRPPYGSQVSCTTPSQPRFSTTILRSSRV